MGKVQKMYRSETVPDDLLSFFELKHHKILISLEDDVKTYIVVAHCVHIIFQMTFSIIW